MSKKLEEKRERRLAEERKRAAQQRAARNRSLTTLLIAVVVGGLVVAAIVMQRGSDTGPIGVAADEAGCAETEEFEDQTEGLKVTHIPVGSEHDPYNSNPPTSGPHYGTPADPGFYPSDIEPEQLVHNLEHGQIVIWYRADAAQKTIEGIEEYVDRENKAARGRTDPRSKQPELEPLLAAPYGGFDDDATTYAMSAWTRLQTGCKRFSSEVVDDFRQEFQGESPEQIAPPFKKDDKG